MDNFERYMDAAGVWSGPVFGDEGAWICPPFFVRLPDPHLFEVAIRFSTKQRGQLWPR
jgi:hypothetical protein